MSRMAADLIGRLEGGERPPEGELLRALRSASCPERLVATLEGCRWVRGARRVMAIILRHPACSIAFAVDAVGRVGWSELLAVTRDPRAAPAVRRLAERRLLERVGEMSQGERVALARRAPRALFALLIVDETPRTIAALLDNPLFCEADAVRLINLNPHLQCVRVALGHARWGRLPAVVQAAVRLRKLPLALAASLAVTLSEPQLRQLEGSAETPAELRQALQRLRAHRQAMPAQRR